MDLFNPVGARSVRVPLGFYDAVVIHYSLLVIEPYFVSPAVFEQIARYDGFKVQFIQDEYRWIDDMTAAIRELGVHVVFTCAEPPEAKRLYGSLPGVETVTTLTGYIPTRLLGQPVRPLGERPIDVGYRGRTVPYWLGALGHDKVRIATGFQAIADEHGLVADIDHREERRIYGREWDRFLGSCRCVLGTESGASITDWDRSIERATAEYLAAHPGASFEEVSAAVLAPHEGNLRIGVISPRVFEATAHGAALVQFPGRYSGIVKPWEHYLPLEPDFSNAGEIVARIRDLPFLEEMTARAHRDLLDSGAYSYDVLARAFDAVVDANVEPGRRIASLARSRGPRLAAGLTGHLRVWIWRPRAVRLALGAQPLGASVRALRGSRAWSLLKRLVYAFVVLRVAVTRGEVRRVAVEMLRLAPHRAGSADLLRLAALVESARRPHLFGFQARAFLDADGTLTLVSFRFGEPQPANPQPAARIRDALAAQAVRRVVWNDASHGGLVSYPVFRSRRIHFTVGRENPFVYEFALAERLVRSAPGALAEVIVSATSG